MLKSCYYLFFRKNSNLNTFVMLLTKTRFMKKLFQSLIVFISITILLSSCSSSNFSKQKYTDFKKGSGDLQLNETVKKQKPAEDLIKKENSSEKINKDVVRPQIEKINQPESNKETASQVLPDENKSPKHSFSSFKNNLKEKVRPQKAKRDGGADLNIILLILLCIFLPPIAILLTQGVGTPFWIDLILFLVGVGALGGIYYLGICYIISVIYAFILCF